MTYTITELTRGEVADYVRAHVEMTVLTYAHLMSPDFARDRRGELPQRAHEVAAEIESAAASRAAGRPPFRRHLVAHNERGGIVGVGASGLGVDAWETEHLGTAWVPPATEFALSHLYLVPGTHGSGLAQRMLDALVPDGGAAYLWVFTENPRAVRFYERNGFAFDGVFADSGTSWGARPMGRMTRPGREVSGR